MAIELAALPRDAEYRMRPVSAAFPLNPVTGGPRQRLDRMGSHWAMGVAVEGLDSATAGLDLGVDLVLGLTQVVALPVPEDLPVQVYKSPRVKLAGQAGMTLIVDGLRPYVPIRKGKFLNVWIDGQRFLHWVTAPLKADMDGEAALPLWPMLRRSPADNAVIELARPMIEGFVDMGIEWMKTMLPHIDHGFTIEEIE